MKAKIATFILLYFFMVLSLTSCEKKENELSDVTLYNPYDLGSGIELVTIDSMTKNYGSLPNLKAFFHINNEYVDSNLVQRLILYRDGIEKGRLSPGNFSFFVDITAQPGGTYNYQLSIIMKDSSYTKLSQPYIILF